VGGRLCCRAQSRDGNATVFLRVVEVAGGRARDTGSACEKEREREREGRREGDQSGVKSQSTSTYAKTCWVLHARTGKLIHGSIASRWYEGDFDAPKLLIAPHEKA
jgi:hypothetical protein